MKTKNIFFALLLLYCATPQHLWGMHEVKAPLVLPEAEITAEEFIQKSSIKTKEDKVRILNDLKWMKLAIDEEHTLAEQVSP